MAMTKEEKARAAEDRKWRARSDARTLADAERIKNDVSRLKMATKEARKIADEQIKEAQAIAKVAGMKKGK